MGELLGFISIVVVCVVQLVVAVFVWCSAVVENFHCDWFFLLR
jgi:hypothetical protein